MLLGNDHQSPCSILSIKDELIPNDAQIEDILSDWLERDDVFSPSFTRLFILLIIGSHNDDYHIHLDDLTQHHFLRGL